MTNKKDFAILEKIEFLKQLKNEDKESLLDLINDKDTKIEIQKVDRYFNNPLRIVIKNIKHTLTIFRIRYKEDILDHPDFKYDDHHNYDRHLVWINNDKDDGINFDYKLLNKSSSHQTITKETYYNYPNDYYYVKEYIGNLLNTDDYLFNFNVVFCLDGKLLGFRGYNADLRYFLKNTKNYALNDIYNFFSQDLKDFNKTNYDILDVFKATKYFYVINVYESFDYLDYNIIFLDKIYFETFLIPKLEASIKPNLDILAKNNLKYKLKIDLYRYDTIDNNEDVNFYSCMITISKLKDIMPNDTIFREEFDFQFHPIKHDYCFNENYSFAQTIKELDEKTIHLANQINTYLQHNILVACFKLEKLLNYSIHNIHINNIKDDNKIYLSKRFQFDYGYFKQNKEDNTNTLNHLNDSDKSLIVWKYQNNTLSFDYFSVYSLCVYLTKHNNNLDEIELKYSIKDPKSFNKIVYYVNGDSISFKIMLPYKTKLEPWENPNEEKNRINLQDFINYSYYVYNYNVEYDKIGLWFSIPTSKNLNEEFNNVYNELKDKIVLKENVQKKMKK